MEILTNQRRRNDDKNNFWEVESKRGGRQGVRKEGRQGTHLEILLSG